MSDSKELKQDNDPAAAPAASAPKVRPAFKAAPCAVCGKPATPAHAPFCSPRCSDVDLNRWLSGSYVIPGREIEADEQD